MIYIEEFTKQFSATHKSQYHIQKKLGFKNYINQLNHSRVLKKGRSCIHVY